MAVVVGAGIAAIGLIVGYQQMKGSGTPSSAAAPTSESPSPTPSPSPAADGSPAKAPSRPAADTRSASSLGSPSATTSATVEGTLIADSTGQVFGDSANGVVTYTVEVMPALSDQLQPLLSVTNAVFGDTTRGWTARGGTALQRIASPNEAQIRIILATPAQVDQYCGDAGLDTSGLYSCWDGVHTMLNSDRWFHATSEFSDLAVYREYLVNHEFGHGLGYDHEYCPGPGEVAPVMQQQSISLQGCKANGWPYPA